MSKINFKSVIFEIIGVFVLLIGLVGDIILKNTQEPFILVSDDYISYIFAAVVTVGALGSTIFSLVLSISDITCLGFTLKEILRFDNSLINVTQLIINSMVPILLGIAALVWDLTNTMSLLLIYEVFNIILLGLRTKKMILDDEKLANIVMSNVDHTIKKGELDNISSYIIIWEIELKKAIDVGDERLQKLYLELFELIYTQSQVHKSNETKSRVEETVRKIFPDLVKKSGFGKAYQELFYRNDCPIYDSTVAIEHYMNGIKYGTVETILLLDVSIAIRSIFDEIKSDNEQIDWILYDYFNAIYSNRIISNELKDEKIKNFFDTLCEINEHSLYNSARKSAIENCFFKNVLQNSSDHEQKNLFEIMISSLYLKNAFWRDPFYYRVVASMFRGAFFYIEYETETLKEAHRKKVKETICLEIDTINKMSISISSIVKENVTEVLEYYIEDSFYKDFSELYEYFPEGYGVKSVIWTREKRIEFAFIFYLVMEQRLRSFSLEKYFSNEKISKDKQKSICRAILNLYDYNTGTLNSIAQDKISKLQEYLNEYYEMSPYCLEENFNIINKRLKELNEQVYTTDNPLIDIFGLQRQLEDKIKEKQEFLLDKTINLDNADEFQINPRFINRSQLEKVDGYLLNCLELAIKNAVSQLIKENFKSIKLTFDAAGVTTLKDKLKSNTYEICNYTFVDDWALNQAVRSSEDYNVLKDEISKITFQSYDLMTGYFFLKSKISLNVEVMLVEGIELNVEQIHQYLNGYKIVEGKYKIDNAIYNTQEAVKWVEKNIYIQYISFKIKIIADGFTIDLVRKTRC